MSTEKNENGDDECLEKLRRTISLVTVAMISEHDVSGVRFGLEWRESSPGQWKITRIGLKPSKVPPFSAELSKQIANVDLVLRSWIDGTIPSLPLDLLDRDGVCLTPTRQKILDALYETVPRGEVVSYKELGERAGLGPSAGRAVGNAMANNPWGLFYPCHRVVNSNLSVGRYGMGPAAKEKLLRAEGVTIRDGYCKRAAP
jgi:O-6-methylguanine DNA methyltransferase